MEGPRALRRDELASCLDLINRVFRAGGGHAPTMAEEFPLLFAPENVGRLQVMLDAGRVVCHVGVLYQTILVGPCELPVACVGAVGTDPAYRGKGLATRALADAMAQMRRDGRVLMLVSGSRTLYTRQGCVPVGRRLAFQAGPADLAPLADPDVAARPRRDDDLAAMRRIHAAEPIRYERTDETFRALLGAFERHRNTTVMLERGGGAAAYLVIRHGGPMAWWGEGVGRVMEYAGSGEALVGGLAAAADLVGVSELSIPVVARDEGIVGPLTSAGIEPKEDTLTGLFRVMDAGDLVRRLRPWWRERLGEAVGGSVEAIESGSEAAGLSVAGQVIPFSPPGRGKTEGRGRTPVAGMSHQPSPFQGEGGGAPGAAAFTRLLFAAERPAGADGDEADRAFRTLAPALPVPLPDSGLNFV